jgi:hypothetical protein
MRAQPGTPNRSTEGIADRFGMVHQTTDRDAAAFGNAVELIAAHRPESVAAIDRALTSDPSLVAAHAASCGPMTRLPRVQPTAPYFLMLSN